MKGEEERGAQNWSWALVLSLLCRVRMPESLAGNDLNARAMQQGRTGEGGEGGWKGRCPSVRGNLGAVAILRSCRRAAGQAQVKR